MLIKPNHNLTRPVRGVNILAISALAVSSLLFSGAAQAADVSEDVQVTIQASDLNSDAGIVKIYEVLTQTAEDSCTNRHARTLADRRIEAACMDDLVEDFVLDIANPALTELHNGTVFVE